MKHIDRRTFLRGAGAFGAASLALPLLPSLGHSQATDFPKRLVIFMSANGTIAPNWVPSSTNGNLTGMSTILEPLERHMDDLLVLEGLDIKVAKQQHQPRTGFHAHERGLGAVLTGMPLTEGPMEANSGYANGISIDQYIANGMMGQTGIHSLQVGMVTRRHGAGWYNRDTMTYAGPEQPLFAQSDGSQLFESIYGGVSEGAAAYERIRKRRQSVLDFLKDDLRRVENRISSEDRQRLAQHHTAFRELETQLSEPAPTCDGPGAPGISNWMNENDMDAISAFQIRQTVQALACDRTRVATMQFGKGLGALSLRCIGYTDSWHGLSHEGDGNAEAQRKLTEMNRYIATRFALLIDEMKSIPEGDGTLLDNSLVIWVNELGKGNNHDHDDVPIVMAGGLQNTFDCNGRHVTLGERAHNDFLITLAQAFGHEIGQFGLPELCSGPIDQLLV